jgi:hypothetical protein
VCQFASSEYCAAVQERYSSRKSDEASGFLVEAVIRRLPESLRRYVLSRFLIIHNMSSSDYARPHGVLTQIIAKLGHGMLEASAEGSLLESEVSR